MSFLDPAENAEHIILKTEFDLNIIMLLLEHLKQFLLNTIQHKLSLFQCFIVPCLVRIRFSE